MKVYFQSYRVISTETNECIFYADTKMKNSVKMQVSVIVYFLHISSSVIFLLREWNPIEHALKIW